MFRTEVIPSHAATFQCAAFGILIASLKVFVVRSFSPPRKQLSLVRDGT